MNEDVKNVWVTALETGKLSDGREVSQTTGWLCIQTDRERMCCLGVLTEEAVIAGVIDRANVDENGLVSYGLYEEIVILDFAVRDWAGIQSEILCSWTKLVTKSRLRFGTMTRASPLRTLPKW